MSIHKDNATGKWRVVYRYTDWTGETHQSSKRGFSTKREAQMWERELKQFICRSVLHRRIGISSHQGGT